MTEFYVCESLLRSIRKFASRNKKDFEISRKNIDIEINFSSIERDNVQLEIQYYLMSHY